MFDCGQTWEKVRLIRVALLDSMALYHSCLQDGCFLIKFYTLHCKVVLASVSLPWQLRHPDVGNSNSPHTSSWHIQSSCYESETNSNLAVVESHPLQHLHSRPIQLCYSEWPQTCDRISQADWDVLSHHNLQFMNLIPWFDMPSSSVCIDWGVHTMTCSPSHVATLCAVSNLAAIAIVCNHDKRSLAPFILPTLHTLWSSQKGSDRYAGVLAGTDPLHQAKFMKQQRHLIAFQPCASACDSDTLVNFCLGT